MRDKNRIYGFIMKLFTLWSRRPDLRFGQLVSNIAAYGGHDDIFYIEDEEMLGLIQSMLDESGLFADR